MREIEIRIGEEVKIFSRFGSSIPETIEFEAEPLDAGAEISGTVIACGSSWIFKKKPREQPLQSLNRVEKGAWDSVFSIRVRPDSDAKIRIGGSKQYRLFWILIGLGILAIVVAGLLIILAGS